MALTDTVLLVGRLDGSVETYDVGSGAVTMAPKPEFLAAEPRAVQRGGSTTLKLKGRNLAAMTGVKSSASAVELKVIAGLGSDELTITATAPRDLTDEEVQITATGPTGESAPLKLFLDSLPQSVEKEPNNDASQATALNALPAAVWGALAAAGDADHYAFDAPAGKPVVIDVASRRVGGKADCVLTLFDSAGNVIASNNDADGSPDPVLMFTPTTNGRYVVKVHDLQIGASPEHFYRLSVGDFPLVTGVFPLGVKAGAESKVHLLGYNLPADRAVTIKANENDESAALPLDVLTFRKRVNVRVLVSKADNVTEAEPNDRPENATAIPAPGVADGRIMPPADLAGAADVDLYRFDAKKGQTWIVETFAARRGSPADTKIEVLDAAGKPVPRVLLRAVRDSYIEFRPMAPNDIGGRLKNWEEMELNEYLYMNGEVVKLFLYPRGPDSQWDFYSLGSGRRCYFDTSAATHAIDDAVYIVDPLPPGSTPPPNGLPTFPLNYVNDDDAERKLGADSRLTFVAPADGAYLVRVSDTRSPGSDRHAYRLAVREAKPDFAVSLTPDASAIPPGSGVGFTVRADRADNFDDDIRVEISNLPPGFSASTPIVIQGGHVEARGTLWAATDAPQTTEASAMAAKLVATGTINGKPVTRDVTGGFGKLVLGAKPMLTVAMNANAEGKRPTDGSPPELTIAPGQMISAWLVANRDATFKDRVSLDVQNLPHGVIVADVGLNGVLIPETETQREIFLVCAPWVPDQERLIFSRAKEAGAPTSTPVVLRVRKR